MAERTAYASTVYEDDPVSGREERDFMICSPAQRLSMPYRNRSGCRYGD